MYRPKGELFNKSVKPFSINLCAAQQCLCSLPHEVGAQRQKQLLLRRLYKTLGLPHVDHISFLKNQNSIRAKITNGVLFIPLFYYLVCCFEYAFNTLSLEAGGGLGQSACYHLIVAHSGNTAARI